MLAFLLSVPLFEPELPWLGELRQRLKARCRMETLVAAGLAHAKALKLSFGFI